MRVPGLLGLESGVLGSGILGLGVPESGVLGLGVPEPKVPWPEPFGWWQKDGEREMDAFGCEGR